MTALSGVATGPSCGPLSGPLSGQGILLIGIGFYDYEAAIAAEMRRLGASVTVLDERPPALRGPLAPLLRHSPARAAAAGVLHRAGMLQTARAMDRLDQVIVIKGETLDAAFLSELRRAWPQARLIAYHWDSMRRYPQLVARQSLYDRVFTFDHEDAAARPGFILRPLFFRPELAAAGAAGVPSTDLCFVGWLHHDRLALIASLRDQAADLGLSRFFHLFTGRWTALKLRARGQGTDVSTHTVPFADYVQRAAASRALIDLPHPGQSGLTMRALEALGLGRKLVTTSRDVPLYDFYRPGNIAIIDPEKPRLDPEFLAAPMEPLPPGMVARYGLTAWVRDVTGPDEPAGFLRAGQGGQA